MVWWQVCYGKCCSKLATWNHIERNDYMAKNDSEKAYLTFFEDLEQSKRDLSEEKESLLARVQEIDESLSELEKTSKALSKRFELLKKQEEELQELMLSLDLPPKKRKRKMKKQKTDPADIQETAVEDDSALNQATFESEF